ncbi:LPS translocon maturation chaperone LptM [Candidatus Methylobacter favarea]|nr:lipoprotein [Candidatus Methylobacter favarea]
MKTPKLFIFLLLGSVLPGCGQPGPLYLPDSRPPIHVEPEPEPEKKPATEPKKEPETKPAKEH